MPNVQLYYKLSHDLLRPRRFNQALLRFGAALHAALKRHQSAVGVNEHDLCQLSSLIIWWEVNINKNPSQCPTSPCSEAFNKSMITQI